MKKDTQSSMEFHINKKESYYINSGKLYLGLRYGRAKQKIIKLNKNDIFLMRPGTMHMRMSQNDTNIIEMCTADSNNDSIIVHDGKKYKFYEE
jgi:mannose-6-phosphate isomerase-like protein (cupin superfamily)